MIIYSKYIIMLKRGEVNGILGEGSSGSILNIKVDNVDYALKITEELDFPIRLKEVILDPLFSNFIKIYEVGDTNVKDFDNFNLDSEDLVKFKRNLQRTRTNFKYTIYEKVNKVWDENPEVDEYILFSLYLSLYAMMIENFDPNDIHMGNIGCTKSQKMCYKIKDTTVTIDSPICGLKLYDYGMYKDTGKFSYISNHRVIRKIIYLLQHIIPVTSKAKALFLFIRNKENNRLKAYDVLYIMAKIINKPGENCIVIPEDIMIKEEDLSYLKKELSGAEIYGIAKYMKIPFSYVIAYIYTKPLYFDVMDLQSVDWKKVLTLEMKWDFGQERDKEKYFKCDATVNKEKKGWILGPFKEYKDFDFILDKNRLNSINSQSFLCMDILTVKNMSWNKYNIGNIEEIKKLDYNDYGNFYKLDNCAKKLYKLMNKEEQEYYKQSY